MWKFYVYRLVDPENGSVFYVGKGCGNRLHQHLKEAISGKGSNKGKTKRILSILAKGKEPRCEKIACFKDEKSAYEFEHEQIRQTEGLTNISVVSGARRHRRFTDLVANCLLGGYEWALEDLLRDYPIDTLKPEYAVVVIYCVAAVNMPDKRHELSSYLLKRCASLASESFARWKNQRLVDRRINNN